MADNGAAVTCCRATRVFEFKLDGTVEEALTQIDSKGYLIPYSVTKDKNGNDKKLVKIGVSFDSEKRTLGEWKIVEKVSSKI